MIELSILIIGTFGTQEKIQTFHDVVKEGIITRKRNLIENNPTQMKNKLYVKIQKLVKFILCHMYRGTSFYLLPFMYTDFIQEFSQYIYLDRSLNFGNKSDMKFQRQNTI